METINTALHTSWRLHAVLSLMYKADKAGLQKGNRLLRVMK